MSYAVKRNTTKQLLKIIPTFLIIEDIIVYNMLKPRYAQIPIEEDTRDKLKVLKKEKTYDQFINELIGLY